MVFAVFISGPYSGNEEENIQRTIEAGDKIISLGGLPLIPHLWHYIDKYNKRDYDTWFNLAMSLLDRADCLLRLPGVSPGADREVQKALELNIPIFHSLEELEEAFKIGSV